jgi:hypothetical protein
MQNHPNPFPPSDGARHAIWEMLVRRDIKAYVAQDWDAHFQDFAPENFFALDGNHSANPDDWRLTYADIARYRDAWLASAAELRGRMTADELTHALFALTSLVNIELGGDFALARKKFDGQIAFAEGEPAVLRWQTLYFCRRIGEQWRIVSFLGYLPNPMP